MRNGSALNVCHSFASKTHRLTVGEMAGLELRPQSNSLPWPRIVEKTGRKLACGPTGRFLDVTDEYNRPGAKLRLIPSTGLLKRLESHQICVLIAAEYRHDDGRRYVKAAYSVSDAATADSPEPWNRLLMVTCSWPGPNLQPSKAAGEDYYLWSTGMQAEPGWWLELRQRCSCFSKGMGGARFGDA